MNVIMIGTPGCGKGTQASELAAYLNIPTISIGQVLRHEIEKGTELGRLVSPYVKKGTLVPDDLTASIVRKNLLRDEYKNGVILDGYPRNIVQAEILDDFFKPDYVIFIEILDQEAIKRITGRRVCSKCGATYHIDYKPPKEDGVCDKCGAELELREDSTEEVFKKRLEVYHMQTEPVVGFYEKKGILVRVNGEQQINEVFEEIISKVKANNE